MTSALEQCRALCDLAGFDPACVADSLLVAAIRRRRIALEAMPEAAYAELLHVNPDEQAELQEELFVRESWFFRDRLPFDQLIQHARTHWRGRSPQQPVHVLSAPCANGEEPYSIAMALADAGVPIAAHGIVAVDLSRRALAHARTATYARKALRDVPPMLVERYLERVADDSWQVQPALRATVDFRRGNLLDLTPVVGGRSFDAVFCRNGLIYLTAAARDRLLAQLRMILAPEGLLFLGSAESGLAHAAGLAPAGPPGAFVFKPIAPSGAVNGRMVRESAASISSGTPDTRPGTTPGTTRGMTATTGLATGTTASAAARASGASARLTTPEAGNAAIADSVSTERPAQPLPSVRSDRGSPTHESLRHLADAGRYAEALAGAQALLANHPADADLHHLCGLILTAMNTPDEARRCYERALYLDPTHVPSLALLQGLLEARGETAAAARLHARIQRAGARS